jgi:hypothetical protein
MKKFLILSIISIMLWSCCGSCPTNPNANANSDKYVNEDFVIVGTSENCDITRDKFHTPVLVKMWLIQSVKNPMKFAEITDRTPYIGITDEKWYNTNKGDTIHYDFISKKRFFNINPDKYQSTKNN